MADYFGYRIFYVMNITDIDDKIIKRARSNHLAEAFIDDATSGQMDSQRLLDFLVQALDNYKLRRQHETDPSKLEMIANILKTSTSCLDRLRDAIPSMSQADVRDVLDGLRDVIADERDSTLGHTISDHQIFRKLTKHFEREFHDDMHRLDILPPNALTRVSDFIQEIGLYIKKIEANGFAYRAPSGSIYFDTNKFDSSPIHTYAKLVREAYGHTKSLDEGEGELSIAVKEKRSSNDFALWKRSKPGEPSWECQDFVTGRPGWHIECSVMASHLLGCNIDIHSGGCDLKFPHHDNEIAQAEAYYNTGDDWINYFLHSGHLTISGCKMSKSLKNFITIRKALEDYSPRQLRLAFLAHDWTDTLDYSENTMKTAKSYEKVFKEYLLNVSDYLRRCNHNINQDNDSIGSKLCDLYRKWSQEDLDLNAQFLAVTNKVDLALCDNMDTRSALNYMCDFVKEYNKRPNSDPILVKDAASYVYQILKIFGASFEEFEPSKSLVITSPRGSSIRDDANFEASLYKYVDALARFRSDVRSMAKMGDARQGLRGILETCDKLRDEVLPKIGVQLEDKEEEQNSLYILKFVDPETLAKERAEKEAAKRMKDETAKLEKLKITEEREKKMRIPPNEMFIDHLDKYSKFDDKGMPTHDSTGKEISKSAMKKLQRLYAEQETKYNKYLSLQGS